MDINELNLSKSFEKIGLSNDNPEYINEIIEYIIKDKNENFNRNEIKKIISKQNIENQETLKKNLLDIILKYVNWILLDNVLTEHELNSIRRLKILLNINEGDFYNYRKKQVRDIIDKQLRLIYRDDDTIDDIEALHKVGLQRLFDLSYDQFLEFANLEDYAAIERGANVEELDTFIRINDPLYYDREERSIPQDVKDLVWKRDDGKCSICGSNEKLEFDHIIPFSKGGSNTYRNIQLLCESCNRKKSSKI